jgi:hypothetical protein
MLLLVAQVSTHDPVSPMTATPGIGLWNALETVCNPLLILFLAYFLKNKPCHQTVLVAAAWGWAYLILRQAAMLRSPLGPKLAILVLLGFKDECFLYITTVYIRFVQ